MTDRNSVLIDHEELNAALAWLEEVPEGAWQSRCRLFCERFDIARLGGTARALAVWFAEYAAIRALKQEGASEALPDRAPARDTSTSISPQEQGIREALEWYGEQARLARLIHSEGDPGRHALAEDGGKRARRCLSSVGRGGGGK